MHVTIYSTPTCPWCKKTKSLLDEHDVPYTDIDVSMDDEQAEIMIRKSGQRGVPVIVIKKDRDSEEEILVGYDEKELKKMLDL